tara:strand:- start:35028 stop:35729 length:702 start_codon:yes stop_codon:yes gene_type:complete
MSENCWAIIPARGGSKGVPGKNIKLLSGKPLIGYAIEALLQANVFEKIIVTSDSEDILSVAKKFGASTHMRSNPEDSDDVVMTDLPVISYLKGLAEVDRPKFCLMVQCTAPFVTSESYLNAFKKLILKNSSTVFAAHTAHKFLWQREHESNSESNWLPINHPFHERLGRQFSRFEQVNETGAFYGFPVKEFLEARFRFFSNAYPVFIKGDETIDIDDHHDWEFAQFKIAKKKQ